MRSELDLKWGGGSEALRFFMSVQRTEGSWSVHVPSVSDIPSKHHPDPGLLSIRALLLSILSQQLCCAVLVHSYYDRYSECVLKVCVYLLGAPTDSLTPASPASPTQDIWVLRSSPTGKGVCSLTPAPQGFVWTCSPHPFVAILISCEAFYPPIFILLYPNVLTLLCHCVNPPHSHPQ